MMLTKNKFLLFPLQYASTILFAGILIIFGALSSKFLELSNLVNILVQSSSAGVVAIGMTFVLLTAGIDLSVGSIMFLSAVVAGKMALSGYPLTLAFTIVILIGILYGTL